MNDLLLRDDNSTSGSLGISGSGLGQRLFAQHDATLDVTALVNTSGVVVQRFTYGPYGTVTVLSSSWASATDAYSFNPSFQGMWQDSVTGLYYTPKRDYSAALGRWMQADPAGYVDGPNVYQFELSCPNAMVDPLGTTAVSASVELFNGISHQTSAVPFFLWVSTSEKSWDDHLRVQLSASGEALPADANGRLTFQGHPLAATSDTKGAVTVGTQQNHTDWKPEGAPISSRTLKPTPDATHCTQVDIFYKQYTLTEPDDDKTSAALVGGVGTALQVAGYFSANPAAIAVAAFGTIAAAATALDTLTGKVANGFEVLLMVAVAADGKTAVGAYGFPTTTSDFVTSDALTQDTRYSSWIHADPGGATGELDQPGWDAAR